MDLEKDTFDPSVPSRTSTMTGYTQAVERVIGVMHERMVEDWTLEALAELAWMSPYHFNRVFHRMTGLPPGQFLGALRLDRAKRLLLTGDRPVTDICFDVGYASVGNFTSRFTQMVGLSPNQLRQLAQEFRTEHLQQVRDFFFRPTGEGPARANLTGRIEPTPAVRPGPAFIGLFTHAVPQSRPIGCTVASAPGDFSIQIPRDGRYFLLAVRWPDSTDPLDLLLEAGPQEPVATAGPVQLEGGKIRGRNDLILRPRTVFDPPLLVALPLLLAEKLLSAPPQEPHAALPARPVYSSRRAPGSTARAASPAP